LITNEKDLREHGYVVQYIHEALTDLCSVSEANAKPSLLKLTRCQHLLTTFRGTLRRNVKDADLLERLHPTPAVGGWPTDRTIDDISRLEFFDRGWYAGPVGWISRDAEQFVVGIRAPGSLKAPACTSSQAQASWTGQFQKMSGTRSKTKSVIFSLCSTHRYSLSDITTNLQ
jgi:menaquinone-specific isochorismate synthase